MLSNMSFYLGVDLGRYGARERLELRSVVEVFDSCFLPILLGFVRLGFVASMGRVTLPPTAPWSKLVISLGPGVWMLMES